MVVYGKFSWNSWDRVDGYLEFRLSGRSETSGRWGKEIARWRFFGDLRRNRSEKNEDAPVGWPGHSAAPRLTFAILPPILRLAPLRPESSRLYPRLANWPRGSTVHDRVSAARPSSARIFSNLPKFRARSLERSRAKRALAEERKPSPVSGLKYSGRRIWPTIIPFARYLFISYGI